MGSYHLIRSDIFALFKKVCSNKLIHSLYIVVKFINSEETGKPNKKSFGLFGCGVGFLEGFLIQGAKKSQVFTWNTCILGLG